jgi:hypothetical protein
MFTIGFLSGRLTMNTSGGGSPQLTLETGSNDAVVILTQEVEQLLHFFSLVRTGDESSDLDYISTSALTLNGATITDASGVNVDLTASQGARSGSL